jgi:hypothetical protein
MKAKLLGRDRRGRIIWDDLDISLDCSYNPLKLASSVKTLAVVSWRIGSSHGRSRREILRSPNPRQ